MGRKKWGIAVHGGAGTLSRKKMSPEREAAYHLGLTEALDAGYALLEADGQATDAVEAAVLVLENNPLFNAGKGAVFNHEGGHEMDASIMSGATLEAGAVCGVKNIRNPVVLAKAVMVHSPHVLLCGAGAEQFAREQDLEFADDAYFFSEERHAQWKRALDKNIMQLDDGSDKKFGTVGAVALDAQGTLAAATSTGGLTNKLFGRIGDSPIIGAGTYANNKTCAVSCTGHGELFMRLMVAYDVHALMDYKDMLLKEACRHIVHKKLVHYDGEGGLIAMDRFGNIELSFNSAGMYRGFRKNGEPATVAIY